MLAFEPKQIDLQIEDEKKIQTQLFSQEDTKTPVDATRIPLSQPFAHQEKAQIKEYSDVIDSTKLFGNTPEIEDEKKIQSQLFSQEDTKIPADAARYSNVKEKTIKFENLVKEKGQKDNAVEGCVPVRHKEYIRVLINDFKNKKINVAKFIKDAGGIQPPSYYYRTARCPPGYIDNELETLYREVSFMLVCKRMETKLPEIIYNLKMRPYNKESINSYIEDYENIRREGCTSITEDMINGLRQLIK